MTMKNRSDIQILFVDDEPDILSSLSRFLRREPFKKLFVENGFQALELLETNDISIIVSDLRMPEMNGLELINKVKEHHPGILRLILSGSQDIDQIIESINTGEVFRFIPKPVEPNAFKKILNDAIDFHCLITEHEELFKELSIKNQELTKVNTALRNMAEELQRSEEQFRSMTDAAHDAVFMLNHEGKIIYRNTSAETIFGFSRDEYREQYFADLISPECAEFDGHLLCEVSPDIHLVYSEDRVHQIEGLRKNGSSLPLEISTGCVQIGSVYHTVVIARDVTTRVEEELSRQRYDSMQKELESEIEKKLLQSPVPGTLHGASISRLMIPSGHLDGDFTDFILHDNQHADILIGDVMGHGIKSALVGAGIKSLFLKVLAQEKYRNTELPDLADIVKGVHTLCINELMELGTFATLLFMRLDLHAAQLSVIDCGHPSIIHFHADTGTCSMLKGENLPMGMMKHEEYQAASYPIQQDDVLVLYSDGITESCSPDNIMFGEEQLVTLIQAHHSLAPETIIEKIKTALFQFAGSDSFFDDVTCIVIRIVYTGAVSQP
jgi:sigma-B regulation protein RsbU (phosphoserine phosphatase)